MFKGANWWGEDIPLNARNCCKYKEYGTHSVAVSDSFSDTFFESASSNKNFHFLEKSQQRVP